MGVLRVNNRLFDAREFYDFANEFRKINTAAARRINSATRETAKEGQLIAKRNARETARRHGKHYPRSITMSSAGRLAWEYGPDSDLPQGGMSFEFGSRNQPPHLDLARSADQIEGRLPWRVQAAAEDAFDDVW